MNIKEFLKPTKWKIIIFLILTIVISFIISVFLMLGGGTCMTIGLCPTAQEIMVDYMLLYSPISMVISYFLACLIVNKVKKK